jgi:hypothetical protein
VRFTANLYVIATGITQKKYEPIVGTNSFGFQGKTVRWKWSAGMMRFATALHAAVLKAANQYILMMVVSTLRTEPLTGLWTMAEPIIPAPISIHTTGVKTYAPNPFGLYDMAGNLMQWCTDWYGIYSADEVRNPSGSVEGLVSGGSLRKLVKYRAVSLRRFPLF